MVLTSQWIKLSVVLLLALLTRIILANPGDSRAARARAWDKVITENADIKAPEWNFATQAGAAVLRERAGWAMGWSVSRRATYTEPVWADFEMGANYWGVSPKRADQSAFGLAFTSGFTYRFPDFEKTWFRPAMGGSVGAHLRTGNGGNVWYFLGFIRPTLHFRVTDKFLVGVETRVGVLGTDFLFSPLGSIQIPL